MNLLKRFKGNGALFFVYLVILIITVSALILYSRESIYLFINRHYSPFFDIVFKYLTLVGAFSIIAPVIVVLFFKSFRLSIAAIFSSLLATILVQIGKHLIWPDSPRPKVVFESLRNLHFVSGVHLNSAHSFPSGHTAGAFALFMLIAIFSKKQSSKFLCLLVACLVGYSRMYLSQHFLIDVFAGSVFGTLSAIFCYMLLTGNSFGNAPWLDKSVRIPRIIGK